MTILISNETRKNIPRSHIESVATDFKAFLKKKKIPKSLLEKEVVLVFLEEEPARALNLQFRKKDYATDVLSFESGDPDCLGELVMCPVVLEKQAKENNHSFKWELTYMFIHGVLHLLGFDHEKSEVEAQRMFQLQDSFFDSLKK